MVVSNSTLQKDDILTYLREIKPSLKKEGIEKLGLFGSYAKNSADLYSDIDLAIKLKENYLQVYDVWSYFTLLHKIKKLLSNKFQLKCDILDLGSDSFIKKNIQEEIIFV